MAPDPTRVEVNKLPIQREERERKDMSETRFMSQGFSPSPSHVHPNSHPHSASHCTTNLSLMFRETERLKTYSNWPVPFLDPKVMAASGFYFTQSNDTVRCPFCSVDVGQWEPGDNPMADHRKYSPLCRFVKGDATCENVTAEAELASTASTSSQESGPASPVQPYDSGYDTCGPYGIHVNEKASDRSLEKLKVQKARPPSFPDFVTEEARLRSFESWPVSLKLKPQVLSEAGFFYTGKGDQTLCFHCGGGLKDWEETDRPWVEHARWFSKCKYVLLIKGQQFIDHVLGKDRKKPMETEEREQNGAPSNSSNMGGLPTTKGAVSEVVEAEMSEPEQKVSDERMCKICFTSEMGVAFLPCGHVVACPKCALSLSKCPSCRQQIDATVRIFLS